MSDIDMNSSDVANGYEMESHAPNQQQAPEDEYSYLDNLEEVAEIDGVGSSFKPDTEADDESFVEDDDALEADEIQSQQQKPRHKRPGYYARINQEQRRRDEERAEAERLRLENARLLAERQALSQQQQHADEPDEVVQIKNFIGSLVKQQLAPLQQQQEQQQQEQQQKVIEKNQRQFERKMDAAINKYADFEDVALRNPEIVKDYSLMGAIKLLPNPAEVMRHLGRNENTLYRLKDLPQLEQAAEIVRIGQEIAARAHALKFSGTPDPITRGGGGKTVTRGVKSVGAMTQEDYFKEAESW